MVQLKRAYEESSGEDGKRILVDRLWPRGLTKERAALDRWAKELAPSASLRKWFSHDPEKWTEFQRRYREELVHQSENLRSLADEARDSTVTLLYAARDQAHNEAVVLKAILDTL